MTNTTHNAGLDSSLSEAVTRVLQDYLDTLGGHEATNIYRLVLDEVERPMLEIMMRYTHGNQSRAAQCLGINRATLLTKLKRHNLLGCFGQLGGPFCVPPVDNPKFEKCFGKN